MKTEAQYKEESNYLIGGALHSLKRALFVRKQIAKLGKAGNKHATGPVAVALAGIIKTLEGLSTYKGSGERNPGKAAPRPAVRARR